MPYEIKFTNKLEGKSDYINECCFGGDVVVDLLLPIFREHYSSIQSDQEDWGWFIWFKNGNSKCAVDIFCEDPNLGLYIIHAHCYDTERKYLVLKSKIENKHKLERLIKIIIETIQTHFKVNPYFSYKAKFA